MKAKWKTWAPFQAPQVREICAHMTDAEKGQAALRSGYYGLWVAATFAIPLSFVVIHRSSLTFVIAAVLIPIHIACIPFWLRMQRQFFCSTEWAAKHGFKPDQLKCFAFRQ